ncbi:uncharacterized protein TNCV_4997261 [Trichonephila clavipes]|nr:uncharacterized protein TNCV_4997261 [Trichonephila clavipes]
MAIVVKRFYRSSLVLERKNFLINFNLEKLLSPLATLIGRVNNILKTIPRFGANPGLPSEAEEENCDLIVLDDMMNDVTSEISQMFTMGSHHKKYSIILITQNLFPRVKSMRDISLNAHYIILFRNNRDVSQTACFGRQAFPGRGNFFMDSYKKATEEPFSYLLVDVHPRSPEVQRLQTLKDANYTFNDKNEFEVDGKPEYRSNVVDLFSYMMKNDQRVLTPPTGFTKFYAALRHVNIPLEWIGNKRLR